ncbi:hypothetical protein OC844_004979 [Tilletia horrida]|nr:hypothetical protein OC844_004979 [Tilletia horrida]
MPADPLASLFTPTPPSSPLFGPTPSDSQDNGGYPSDQAAEYDSTPTDSIQGSAAGSEPEDGEDLVIEPPSSDAGDNGEDLADFVNAGPPSSQSTATSEESAEFTDTDVSSSDAGDAQAELDMAEADPEGEFVPNGEIAAGDDPDEDSTFGSDNDADDEGGEDGDSDEGDSDDEDDTLTIASDGTLTPIASQAGTQIAPAPAPVSLAVATSLAATSPVPTDATVVIDAAAVLAGATIAATAVIAAPAQPTVAVAAAAADPVPDPFQSPGDEAADAEFEQNGFVVTGHNMQGGPATSQDSASITTAMKRANPLAPPPIKLAKVTVEARVLCKWIHDDRIRLPLLAPWKHGDPSSPTQPGRRLLEARLIRIGDDDTDDQVQFKSIGNMWTWAWNVRLWRTPQPPTCSGCTGNETVEVVISKPAHEVTPADVNA